MPTQDEQTLANLRKGVVEPCLLALLRDGELYGVELARRLSELGLIASEGSLYPLLARLRADGLVTYRREQAERGRPRQYYALTVQGRASLKSFSRLWTPFSRNVTALIEGASS